MDKEKEIEEMAEFIGETISVRHEGDRFPLTVLTRDFLAKRIINKGYRKADEVRKEMRGEIERVKAALTDAVRSFTRVETLYKIKCNELEAAKKSAGKEKAKEILCGLVHWLNGAISDSYNFAVKNPLGIYGGKNLAFHEMLDLVKKIAEEEGVGVDE